MISKRGVLFFCFTFLCITALFAEDKASVESDQQINDFSLAGFADKGKKSWDISGKSADIFTEVVKLQDVVGNLYGEKENIKLTADKGDFNKNDGKVRLQDNVVITTSSGAKLTTDSLDWDRKNQFVSTKDPVNIAKENIVTTAQGATGQPDLNKVTLQKDVRVDINSGAGGSKAQDARNNITITCDGPLEIDYQNNIAAFKNNVKVDNQGSLIFADTMDVYFSRSSKDAPVSDQGAAVMGSKIEKIIARGNVKIVRGENISYSDEAIYSEADKKIILKGQPRLVIYSTEGINAPFRN